MTAIVAKQGYRELLELAARLEPAYRRAFLEAVLTLDLPTRAAVLDAMERRDSQALAPLWDQLDATLTAQLRPVVERLIVGAGVEAIGDLPASVQAQLAFDLTNPAAVDVIDSVTATAIADIVNASQQGIQEWLRRAFVLGIPPETLARRLRQHIGLTPSYSQAVENYRAGLLAQDVAAGRADEQAQRYAARLLRRRALTIARTETMRAANAGSVAAWQDAQAKGLLATDVRKGWVVTEDDRLCPICEAIPDLNPDGVLLDQPFRTDLGDLYWPPVHPACRCVPVLLHP